MKNQEPFFARAAWRAKVTRGTKRDDHAAGFVSLSLQKRRRFFA